MTVNCILRDFYKRSLVCERLQMEQQLLVKMGQKLKGVKDLWARDGNMIMLRQNKIILSRWYHLLGSRFD